MKLTLKARDWHSWISIILLLPLLLVGFTSFFLAHKKSLGINDIDLTDYVSWLPGYRNSPENRNIDVRCILKTGGRVLIGTTGGLFEVSDSEALPISDLAGFQIRDLAEIMDNIVAATKEGVWLEHQGVWQPVFKGDAWNLAKSVDGGIIVAIKDKGFFISHDGFTWVDEDSGATAAVFATMEGNDWPRERVTMGKLMIDLHTGKAFLGKRAEWLWIDILAAAWVFLCFTGLWVWWRIHTRKRNALAKYTLTKDLDGGSITQ